MKIVPVGVGVANKNTLRISSARPFSMGRLDFLGYSAVTADFQELLASYVNGEIGMTQLAGQLETTQ